jgi:nanoRNase/pAp phosphatase (c-di-AMP/oligoRNAs hydrolase)
MGAPATGAFLASARHVTIIGHNSQIVPTARYFIGGALSVRMYTTNADLETDLAAYPTIQVTVVPNYDSCPADLPEPPYVVAIEDDDEAKKIRAWLPPTVSIFLATSENRRRPIVPGFLNLKPSAVTLRRSLLRRLLVLKRVDTLLNLVRGKNNPYIIMYSNPDPDAIGAALGLAALWQSIGITAHIRYTGDIQRYQNKLLLQYLKQPIERLEDDELTQADVIAVVDAQPGFWRENPPAAHIIIDHHPKRDDSIADFVDIRAGYGSTSTILTEYLTEASVPISKMLATALLYGLTTDTDDLNRHAGAADIHAFDVLHAKADHHFLTRLDKSQVPMSVLDYIAWGISHRVVVRDMILIHFGEIPTADILVQTADQLLMTCGINWTVCAGIYEQKLIVVFRGDGHRQDVGKRATLAFGKIGSAGGHRTMGRAEIPLTEETSEYETAALLIDNLFRRMSPKRRARFIRTLKSHLKGDGPDDHEDFELAT